MGARNLSTEEQVLKDYIEELSYVQDEKGFTDWEREFISSVAQYRDASRLSEKQKSSILKMVEKYDI